jgi:hypothetical protein
MSIYCRETQRACLIKVRTDLEIAYQLRRQAELSLEDAPLFGRVARKYTQSALETLLALITLERANAQERTESAAAVSTRR